MPVQTSALVDVHHLITRLASLAKRHRAAGRISHALGVQSALDLIRRERKAGRGPKPQN
ncbi:hypothetical protein [Polaromonas hydrogenivorans]|uniref:Uncharacterized protein n=1 Tax=Polaromonas hydrogenivorans TaxID=335476 RepID=A0AAU7LWI0_9BURK